MSVNFSCVHTTMLKKDQVAKLGLVKFNASCDWQIAWLQVRKPFDRGVKFASLKTTKLIFIT